MIAQLDALSVSVKIAMNESLSKNCIVQFTRLCSCVTSNTSSIFFTDQDGYIHTKSNAPGILMSFLSEIVFLYRLGNLFVYCCGHICLSLLMLFTFDSFQPKTNEELTEFDDLPADHDYIINAQSSSPLSVKIQ